MMESVLESPIDRAFVAALDHFLRIEGLSVNAFCRRTASYTDDGHMLILPTQVTKWRSDTMPSARKTMITAAVFGVSRSYFYFVGEMIEKGQQPEPEPHPAKQRLAVVRGRLEELQEVEDIDEALLNGLEAVLVNFGHARSETGLQS